MSDRHDEKLNNKQKGNGDRPEEDIFSAARSKSRDRVVPFPVERTQTQRPQPEEPEEGPEAQRPRKPEQEPEEKKTAEIIDLPPENLAFELSEKLKKLVRKAEDYADQMYQQAEPTAEELHAEQYIPGVDVEEFEAEKPEEEEQPGRTRRVREAAPPPEDIPPKELARRYTKGLNSARLRVFFGFLVCIVCTWISCGLPILTLGWTEHEARLMGCVLSMGMVMLLCYDVLWAGVKGLIALRPGAESLMLFSALFTLIDGLTMPVLGLRGGNLPCAAPACFVLVFALWGRWSKQRADRLACRTAAQVRAPYLVTRDESKWSGRPGYCKWQGAVKGFGSQIQMEDGVQQVYRVAAPLLLLACLLLALLASVGRRVPSQCFWAASCLFTTASSFSAMLVFGLPYHGLTRRLSKTGAAVAGWAGVSRCGEGSIVLSDADLFPPGTVKLNGIKVFGDFPNEKVVGYTATMVRAARCGLNKPFTDLAKSQNALFRNVTGVRFHEGGVTGIIRNQEVIVGTASFMHLMNIAMPQGLNVKNALFCAIDGHLAGIFALHYAMQSAVKPCLSTLMRNRIAPLLATRDPNLIPSLLGQKFKLPVDKMEFPSVDRRLELSDPEQTHSETLVAVLCREGLTPFCDAVTGACRLRTATRLGTVCSLLGTVLGVVLTFYLTFVDAYWSLSPAALLVFLFAWLVPILLLADWVNRY